MRFETSGGKRLLHPEIAYRIGIISVKIKEYKKLFRKSEKVIKILLTFLWQSDKTYSITKKC